MKLHELDNVRLVDTVRVLIGLDPLPRRVRQHVFPTGGSYVRLEALRRAANPDCKTCGGSGYFDGDRLEQRCACTGREQRKLCPRRVVVGADPAFAYRERRFPPKATNP